MAKVRKPKRKLGLYVEAVVHGHGAHEIVAKYDVPISKAAKLQALFDSHPELFTASSD